MSAAMVTNAANQLQAVAHLIGINQLPIPARVSSSCLRRQAFVCLVKVISSDAARLAVVNV